MYNSRQSQSYRGMSAECAKDPEELINLAHTAYSWNIICQKLEGDCGLWVLNEMILKKYNECLKKIVGAIWELPAK